MENELNTADIVGIFNKLPLPLIVYKNKKLEIAFISEQMLDLTATESIDINKSCATIFTKDLYAKLHRLLTQLWDRGGQEIISGILIDAGQEMGAKHYEFQFEAIQDTSGRTIAIIQSAKPFKKLEIIGRQDFSEENDYDTSADPNHLTASFDQKVSISATGKSTPLEPIANDPNDSTSLKMKLAIESAELGTWSINVQTSEVFWDVRTRALYGYPQDENVPYDEVLSYIHEEDRPLVDRAVNYALSPASGGISDIKFKTIGAMDGILRWLHAKGKALFNNQGRAILFTGIVQDITETVAAQEKIDEYHRILASKERKLQLIVDSAQVGTFTFDLKTLRIQLNDYSKKLFPVVGQNDNDMKDYDHDALQQFADSASSHIIKSIENRMLCDHSFQLHGSKTQKNRWIRLVGKGFTSEKGKVEKFYGLIIDISRQKEEERKKLSFLGIASHELRTPLTSLSAYLQIIHRKSSNTAFQPLQPIIKNAIGQVGKIRALTETFLDLVHIDQGRLNANLVKTSVKELFSNVESAYIGLSSHILKFDNIMNDYYIMADAPKLEKVFCNIIDNAIKYAPKGTQVECKLEITPHNIHFSVVDQGPGVLAHEKDKLFEQFYRSEQVKPEVVSGFGLGLYIAKQIVIIHKGQIGTENGPGACTTFWFDIPRFSM